MAARSVSVLPLALLACACRVGPDYRSPDLSARTEPAWREPSGPEITRTRADLARWWQYLESDELDALAERLVHDNLSLAEARQRIVAAHARSAIAGADRRPRVDADVGYVRAGTGDQSVNFIGPPPGQEVSVTSAGVAALWELDFWGRVGRLVEAADAGVDVAVEDYRDASVSLLAELALAYVEACSAHALLDLQRRDVDLRRRTVELARSRLGAGNGSRLDVEQAERELERSRARAPELERTLRAAENRVAVLVGARPADGFVAARDPLSLPPEIGIGLPADLLARRADVRAAERRLAEAVARVGVAEAERYPRITIHGTLTLGARTLDALAAGSDALSYSIGPSLVVPLFAGGRLEARVRLEEAQAEAARLAFEQALLRATEEVENAAEGSVRARQRVLRLEAAAARARAAATLAGELYASGLQGLLAVLDAQREELAIESDLLLARQAALGQAIALYRALGGGWEPIGLEGEIEAADEARRGER